jgi:hypothetical protein
LQVARKIAACDMVFIDMLDDNVSNEAVLTMRESHEKFKTFLPTRSQIGARRRRMMQYIMSC